MKASFALVLAGLLALFVVSCGSDNDVVPAAGGDQEATVTVTIDSDGVAAPDQVTGGVVAVQISADPNHEGAVDFTRVAPETTPEEFTKGIEALLAGGEFPDFFEANSGATPGTGTTYLTLEEGLHYVWTEIYESQDDEEPEIALAQMTVSGSNSATLPDTSGTITVVDYGYNVDATAGNTYTLLNDGPNQAHHAVFMDFGDLDPDVVADNLPAFLAADEGTPPPEAFAGVDDEALFIGESGVFTAGMSGTFSVELERDTTYAIVCFISDNTGGPPHAIAHDMYEVFQLP